MSVLRIEIALERALREYRAEFVEIGYWDSDFFDFVAQWLQRQAGEVGSTERAAMEKAIGARARMLGRRLR